MGGDRFDGREEELGVEGMRGRQTLWWVEVCDGKMTAEWV